MGLDMYLDGQKYFWNNWDHPEKNRTEDGLCVKTINVELGYWRKHPNLHGYIVRTFANGKDECQEIALTADNLRQIIAAVKSRTLPETTGFFFGKSSISDEEIADDVAQLERAIAWIETEEEKVERDVIYRASW